MTSILYVMAADTEYGPNLKARITPLMTGIGPVEAAISVTRALAEAQGRGSLPDLVVSLGSAGSAVLEHTGVYQALSVSYRDMDASALGFPRGVTPLLDLDAEIVLDRQIEGVPSVRLSTGGNVVSGAAYDAIDADMVDMESFAVLRACQSFGVPLIVLRGISDGASELTGISDWTRDLGIIDQKLARAIDLIEAQIATLL